MSKRENKIWIALLIATVLSLIGYGIASADVGSQEICNSRTDFNLSGISISSTVKGAQTFTPTETFIITGVKLPLQHLSATSDAAMQIVLYPTILQGGKLRPDLSAGSIASVTTNTSVLPQISGVTTTSQALNCSSEDTTQGTVFEFSSPATLVPSSTYAIYATAGCGTACLRWGIPIQTAPDPNNYAGGQAYNVTASGDPFDPADWDDYCSGCVDGDSDSGFAVYSNVQPVPTRGTVDTWLDNFLASMGLDSAFGKTLAGSLFVMIIFVVLAIKGIPWIISLGIAGFAVTFLTAAAIFDPSILLGLLAIVMLGGIGLIFALIVGGGETNV